jgi:hypothetical protein
MCENVGIFVFSSEHQAVESGILKPLVLRRLKCWKAHFGSLPRIVGSNQAAGPGPRLGENDVR